ncbi:MAG: hypothetical protein K8R54_02710 [Bacteroidales bacterium]|nr:hypothetical protein [Bacteroidales bacterium]
MKKKSITIGGLIIGSAIIWGAVIVGSSFALKGTECYQEIQKILFGGVIIHLILIWGPMGAMFAKLKKENKNVGIVKE